MAENLQIIINAKDNASRAIGGVDQSLGKLEKTAAIAGKALVGGLALGGAAVAALGVAALNAANEFDEATKSLVAGTGASGESLEAMQQSVLALSGTTAGLGKDMGEIGAVLAEVNTRTGATGTALDGLSKSILEMSRVTGDDAVEATAKITRVMGDWGVGLDGSEALVNSLFAAGQQFGIGLGSLSSKLVQFGAPLRQMGFSLEESTAMLGKWEKEGVNTELVIGSLRIAAGKFADAQTALTATTSGGVESLEQSQQALELLRQKLELAQLQQGEFNEKTKESSRLSKEMQIDKLTGQIVELEAAMAKGEFRTVTTQAATKSLADSLRDTFEAIKNAKTETEALSIGMETFGARAGPDMTAAIREGRFELDEAIKAMQGTSNALEDAAKRTVTLSDKWLLFKKQVMNALVPLGTKFLQPVIDRLLTLASESLPAVISAFETFIDRAVLIVGVLGDIWYALDWITSGLGWNIDWWIDITTAIWGQGDAADDLAKKLYTFGNAASKVISLMRGIPETIRSAFSEIKAVWGEGGLPAVTSLIGDWIQNGIVAMKDKAGELWGKLSKWWDTDGTKMGTEVKSKIITWVESLTLDKMQFAGPFWGTLREWWNGDQEKELAGVQTKILEWLTGLNLENINYAGKLWGSLSTWWNGNKVLAGGTVLSSDGVKSKITGWIDGMELDKIDFAGDLWGTLQTWWSGEKKIVGGTSLTTQGVHNKIIEWIAGLNLKDIDFAGKLWGNFFTWWNGDGNEITGVKSKILEWVAGLQLDAINFAGPLWKGLVTWWEGEEKTKLAGTKQLITEWVATLKLDTIKYAGKLWGGLVTWWDGDKTELSTGEGGVLTKVKEWITGLGLDAIEFAGELWGQLVSWWDTGGTQLAIDVIDNVRDWISSIVWDVGTAARNLWYEFVTWWASGGETITDEAASNIGAWVAKVLVDTPVDAIKLWSKLNDFWATEDANTLGDDAVVGIESVFISAIQSYQFGFGEAIGGRIRSEFETLFSEGGTFEWSTIGNLFVTGFKSAIENNVASFVWEINVGPVLDGIFGTMLAGLPTRIAEWIAAFIAVILNPANWAWDSEAVGVLREKFINVLFPLESTRNAIKAKLKEVFNFNIFDGIFGEDVSKTGAAFSGHETDALMRALGFDADSLQSAIDAEIVKLELPAIELDTTAAETDIQADVNTVADALDASAFGDAIIEGGLKSFDEDVTFADKMVEWMGGAFESMGEFLFSRSPSMKAHDELGVPIVEGAILGIEFMSQDFIDILLLTFQDAFSAAEAEIFLFVEGVKGSWITILAETRMTMTWVKEAIVQHWNAIGTAGRSGAFGAGVEMSSGLKSGIMSKAKEIADAAASVVRRAIAAARAAARAASNSKEMIELGADLMGGLRQGIGDNEPQVVREMANAMSSVFRVAVDFAKAWEAIQGVTLPKTPVQPIIDWLVEFADGIATAIKSIDHEFGDDFNTFARGLSSAVKVISDIARSWEGLQDFEWNTFVVQPVIDWLAATGAFALDAIKWVKNWGRFESLEDDISGFAKNISSAIKTIADIAKAWEVLQNFEWNTFVVQPVIDWLAATGAFALDAIMWIQNWGRFNDLNESLGDFADSVSNAIGTIVEIAEAWEVIQRFDWKTTGRDNRPILNWLAAFGGLALSAVKSVSEWSQFQNLSDNTKKVAAAIEDSFSALAKSIQFLTELKTWRAMPDLEEKFTKFRKQWEYILLQFDEMVKVVNTIALEEVVKLASALGAIGEALSKTMWLFEQDLAEFQKPPEAVWAPFMDWIIDVFETFSDWISEKFSDELAANPDDPFGTVSAASDAMGTIWSAFQAALNFSIGFPSDWTSPGNVDSDTAFSQFYVWTLGVTDAFIKW
ncbi:MAG: hypothetical protein GY748_23230, partial [Planctomycetaceae bacterium]|nr:hypothetical protein [Planctomycetaceae bacterium]